LTDEGNFMGLDEIVINNNGINSLILPKVVEYAKKYFLCDEITQVSLENDGDYSSKGQHFE